MKLFGLIYFAYNYDLNFINQILFDIDNGGSKLFLFIVYSAPTCAPQPINFAQKFKFWANLITYFVNICYIYKVNN